VVATVLSVVFAEVAVLGGIVLSLAPGAPISAFVTTISFLIYLVCRAVGPFVEGRRQRAEVTPATATAPSR
jgi:zinc/manganese transport system permease protein